MRRQSRGYGPATQRRGSRSATAECKDNVDQGPDLLCSAFRKPGAPNGGTLNTAPQLHDLGQSRWLDDITHGTAADSGRNASDIVAVLPVESLVHIENCAL